LSGATLRKGIGSAGLLAGLILGLGACGEPDPEPVPTDTPGQASTAPSAGTERIYERSFAFVAQLGDSLLLVPWVLRHEARPDSVAREASAWLARGGTWESFYDEAWRTPATQAPERVLPHGALSLVVRDGDLIDGLVYQDGPRNLEIVMGEVLAAWVGPGGETFDVLEGAAYLSEERIDGLVVDVSRSWTPAEPPTGDWAFLVSGDSLRMVMAADIEHGLDDEPVYRVWAQRGLEDTVWPEARVTWSGRQAFPPARRDVPTAWTVSTRDGSLRGSLESVSAEIRARDGAGPLLPVRALFHVAGTLTADGGSFPVQGILVHQRR
jgi:hypothetical protein